MDNVKERFQIVLGSEANRDILKYILTEGHVYSSVYVPNDANTTAYYAGMRDLALKILKLSLKKEVDLQTFEDNINIQY